MYYYEWKINKVFIFVYFFFQAEDGIRDSPVTGVQTCALPIYNARCVSAKTLESSTEYGSESFNTWINIGIILLDGSFT